MHLLFCVQIGFGFGPWSRRVNPAIQFQTGKGIYFTICLPLNWNFHQINLKRLTR